jgi:hypothetical protein
MNGLVLDIEGGGRNPRTKVVTWHKKDSANDNQLWYDDFATGTIRSKLHDLCLDIEGGHLVVNNYQQGDPNQLWEHADPVIRNRQQPNKVLDISGNKREPGANLCSWDYHGGQNQQFEIEFVGGHGHGGHGGHGGGYQRREFWIVSEMHGKVIDIQGANAGEGSHIIVYGKNSHPSKNQLWYFDQQGVIRSALNDMALSSKGNGHGIKTGNFNGQPHQQFRIDGNRILNPNGECLDIKGASHSDSAEVISYQYKGSPNQHWRIEYV